MGYNVGDPFNGKKYEYVTSDGRRFECKEAAWNHECSLMHPNNTDKRFQNACFWITVTCGVASIIVTLIDIIWLS